MRRPYTLGLAKRAKSDRAPTYFSGSGDIASGQGLTLSGGCASIEATPSNPSSTSSLCCKQAYQRKSGFLMEMRRITEWLSRMLDALPWRRARRPARQKMGARAFSPRQAAFSDPNVTRWQNTETARRYPTWPEAPASPRLKTPTPTPEPPPAQTAIVPAAPPPAASPPPPLAGAAEPEKTPQETERRLTFARYLVRRGTFNEGFAPDALPAQYQPREGNS